MTLKFIEPSQQLYCNVLLYGPPKTGKTAGACSAPGGILLMNLDLPNAPLYARKQYGDRIMEVDFEGLKTLSDVVIGIQQETSGNTAKLVDTVVVDPVGELHRRLLEEASHRAIRPAINIYGDVSVHIERFCRKLCELPVNAVFVCHDAPVKDESTGAFERLPWTGTTNTALGRKIESMVDIVGYTGVILNEDSTKTYAAQLVQAAGRKGGDRFDVLGDFQPLDLSAWFALANPQEIEDEQPVPVG